jgi:hypothetical protein
MFFQATYAGNGDAVAGRSFPLSHAALAKIRTQAEPTAPVGAHCATGIQGGPRSGRPGVTTGPLRQEAACAASVRNA